MDLERRSFIPREEGDIQMTNAEIEAAQADSKLKKVARSAIIAAGTMLAAENMEAQTIQQVQGTEQSMQAPKDQTMKEKVNEYFDVEDNVKKLNEVEKEKYKEYIQSEKGSKQEKDLLTNLSDNNSKLKNVLLKLMSYSSDKNKTLSEKATKVFLEINNEIKQRKKECEAAGKNYFDRTPAPPELPDLF